TVVALKDKRNIVDKDRRTPEMDAAITAIVGAEKFAKLVEAARSSIGQDLSPIDNAAVVQWATKVVSLCDSRVHVNDYLSGRLDSVAPNLRLLLGDVVTSRLISRAGSLENLAKMPSSTLQVQLYIY
ncbi:hypothetical protein KIPB_014436, partial [Kipferlia bialata]